MAHVEQETKYFFFFFFSILLDIAFILNSKGTQNAPNDSSD